MITLPKRPYTAGNESYEGFTRGYIVTGGIHSLWFNLPNEVE